MRFFMPYSSSSSDNIILRNVRLTEKNYGYKIWSKKFHKLYFIQINNLKKQTFQFICGLFPVKNIGTASHQKYLKQYTQDFQFQRMKEECSL